jgi:hypothetical protein
LRTRLWLLILLLLLFVIVLSLGNDLKIVFLFLTHVWFSMRYKLTLCRIVKILKWLKVGWMSWWWSSWMSRGGKCFLKNFCIHFENLCLSIKILNLIFRSARKNLLIKFYKFSNFHPLPQAKNIQLYPYPKAPFFSYFIFLLLCAPLVKWRWSDDNDDDELCALLDCAIVVWRCLVPRLIKEIIVNCVIEDTRAGL